MTVIKPLLLPKVVYMSSLLPTPENIIKDMKHLHYNFLWKGKEKQVIKQAAINDYEGGGMH